MTQSGYQPAIPPFLTPVDGGVRIAVKAVPGASQDAIAGVLGDRLKVRVAAPPEDGKANRAICKLLAKVLGLPVRQVQVDSGHTRPEKSLVVQGATLEFAAAKLHRASP